MATRTARVFIDSKEEEAVSRALDILLPVWVDLNRVPIGQLITKGYDKAVIKELLLKTAREDPTLPLKLRHLYTLLKQTYEGRTS